MPTRAGLATGYTGRAGGVTDPQRRPPISEQHARPESTVARSMRDRRLPAGAETALARAPSLLVKTPPYAPPPGSYGQLPLTVSSASVTASLLFAHMGAPIAVGTCNWADHTDFYPPELEHGRRQREKLSLLRASTSRSSRSTRPSTGFRARRWWRHGSSGPRTQFRFNIKAYRSLTGHEREDRIPRQPTPEEERDFMAALAPLRSSGKLVAVHYQFPPWLTNRPEAREWLLAARDRHPDDLLAIEFRHRSWFDHDAWPATEDLLRELECVYVGVDAPQIGIRDRAAAARRSRRRGCASRGSTAATGRPGTRAARRAGIASTTSTRRPSSRSGFRRCARRATSGVPLHVLLNNNRSNYAVVNAFDFGAMLGLGLPRPPEPVIETLRERDGRVPEWVETSDAGGAAAGAATDGPGERRKRGPADPLALRHPFGGQWLGR